MEWRLCEAVGISENWLSRNNFTEITTRLLRHIIMDNFKVSMIAQSFECLPKLSHNRSQKSCVTGFLECEFYCLMSEFQILSWTLLYFMNHSSIDIDLCLPIACTPYL